MTHQTTPDPPDLAQPEFAQPEFAALSKCWCGMRDPYFAFVSARDGCAGTGTLYCICGGDFCVCHNHGEVECGGCEDCEFDDSDIGEGEDWR